MAEMNETAIQGVRLFQPKRFADDRGFFYEAFRASWLPAQHRWAQWNVSHSVAGVLRGLHYHRRQTDYWVVVQGAILAGLADLRPDSESRGKSLCLELSADRPQCLVIPPGVAHGFRTHGGTTLMYLLDQEYDGEDEYAVKWNDPALGMPSRWLAGPEPTLSARDANAPSLEEIQ